MGIAGKVAMFLVGGGIIAHGMPPVVHHQIEALTAGLGFFKGISVAGGMGVQRLRGKLGKST